MLDAAFLCVSSGSELENLPKAYGAESVLASFLPGMLNLNIAVEGVEDRR